MGLLVARPFQLSNFRYNYITRQKRLYHIFDLDILTSMGVFKIRNCRWNPAVSKQHQLKFPGFALAGGRWWNYVEVTPHMRTVVQKLVLRAIQLEEKKLKVAAAAAEPTSSPEQSNG